MSEEKIYWRIYRGPRRRIRSKLYSHTWSGMRGKHSESCYMQWRMVEKKRGEPSSRMWDMLDHGKARPS